MSASAPEIRKSVGPGRDEKGRILPGQSGNPGGRPKGVAEVVELARKHTKDAMAALHSIATGIDVPPAARVSASVALLERGWGKPLQPTQEQDDEGRAVGRPLIVFRVEEG